MRKIPRVGVIVLLVIAIALSLAACRTAHKGPSKKPDAEKPGKDSTEIKKPDKEPDKEEPGVSPKEPVTKLPTAAKPQKEDPTLTVSGDY